MAISAVIIGGATLAGSVYSANKQAKAQKEALNAQKEVEAKAEATKTQASVLPKAGVSAVDPANIGAGSGYATPAGGLSGVLLGGDTSKKNLLGG